MKRLLSLLILTTLLAASTAMAQTSQVTLLLQSGAQHLLRNDYDGPPNSVCLSNLIGGQVPPGSQCIRFDPVTQGYQPAISRDRDGSWGPAGTTVLARGAAFWLRIPPQGGLVVSSQYEVTFSGNVPTSSFLVTSYPQGNAVGYPYPSSALWTNTQYAKSSPAGSQLMVWNPTNQTFGGYLRTGPGGWSLAASVVLPPGRGCFVFRNSSASTNFIEPKPY